MSWPVLTMSDRNPADWIDALWPAVCARTLRPVSGVRLDRETAGAAAAQAFRQFLAEFPEPPASRETVMHWLATQAAPLALAAVAEKRRALADQEAFRDPARAAWEKNPDLEDLRKRGADGSLASRQWSVAEPILWRRAAPLLTRMGLGEEDARDVYMESVAELTQPRTEAGPLEKITVFEELPRFFGTMIERRAISWQRKQSARKRQATNPALAERLDDEENSVARSLADPRSAALQDPWRYVNFDRIKAACGDALSDLEWHIINALFVEGTQTRLDLAGDAWVLEQLAVSRDSSESKRRRRLNLFIEEALHRLGECLRTRDL